MRRWRTALAGLILVLGGAVYLGGAVLLIEQVPEGHWGRWALYLGLALAWVWPALRLFRWTLKDPGTKIEHLR